jgi:hypothetical protein
MKTPNLFKQHEHNIDLLEKGYAIVQFLNKAEIKALTDFFYQHHSTLPDGMYASSHAGDFAFRQLMNNEIKRVCARAIDVTFSEVTPLGATFMVKSKGENGSLHPHQDWSIVDEEHFNSYNIWLPLVDVNEQNGTLLILPNSHNWLTNIRGLNIPSSYELVTNEVWKYLVPINLKAGEAFIYDHRLLHASGINQTAIPRLAVVYGVIPKKAEMRYYFGVGDTIEEYACSPDFYFNETITQGPASLPLLNSIPNQNPKITLEQLDQKYAPKRTLWQKMTAFLRP